MPRIYRLLLLVEFYLQIIVVQTLHILKLIRELWFAKNSKVCSIKILLDSGASAIASIIHKDELNERHRIQKDKKNQWSTMAATFNTSFVTEIILKLPELNHSAEIYEKCHLTNKLLIHNLILGRDILHKLGIIFH